MSGKAQTQFEICEQDSPEWHQLIRENGSLRAIIAELLIRNQNLRWELLVLRDRLVHEPGLIAAAEGTPLRRNSLIPGMP
jgi:regulator of replication initiation timing